MNQGAFMAVMLAGGFVLYLAKSQRLAVYLGMLMGGGAAAPATASPAGGSGVPASSGEGGGGNPASPLLGPLPGVPNSAGPADPGAGNPLLDPSRGSGGL